MSCRCECCTRKLGASEIAHGIRYERADEATGRLIPAMESATTLLCGSCATMFLKLVYQKLSPPTSQYSSLF
jgi:hypothetical protein